MTLAELRARFYWAINDDPTTPRLVPQATVDALLNDGLRSLADSLHIIRGAGGLALSPGGTVDLPQDFREMMAISYGGVELKPIDDIRQAAVGSGSTTQYLFVGSTKVALYDIPPMPQIAAVIAWYKGYPTPMAAPADVPEGLPVEFHEALATVYVRSEYAKQRGYLSQYNLLREQWEALKGTIQSVVEARTKPLTYQRGWRW